jgi:hypothetical protein
MQLDAVGYAVGCKNAECEREIILECYSSLRRAVGQWKGGLPNGEKEKEERRLEIP